MLTATSTGVPCTTCSLQLTSVQVSCNADGTIHWKATVLNSAACQTVGSRNTDDSYFADHWRVPHLNDYPEGTFRPSYQVRRGRGSSQR